MDMTSFTDFLQYFETSRILELLQKLEVDKLIYSPAFLISATILAIIALFMQWRVLLVGIFTFVGLSWVASYILQSGATPEKLSYDVLLLSIGSGAVVIFLIVYLFFVRSD